MSEKVLVTGGAGFIGSNVTAQLVDEGYNVTVLDSFETGFRENLKDLSVTVVEGDIRDENLLADQLASVEGVFHLAAHVGNRKSIEYPIKDAEINVEGTVRLLDLAQQHGVSKVVYSSSAAIYGEVEYTPIDESHPVEPDSPYGVTKLAGEKEALCFSKLYDLNVACLRYFNVYGVNQRYDEYGNVIPIWTNRLLNDEPLIIYGDGEQTRDFINVRDVARANINAYSHEDAEGAYNIGTGTPTKIRELAEMFVEIGKNAEIIHEAPRKGEVRHSVAKIERANEDFGFDPKVTLRDGLKEYIDWMRRKQLSHTNN